MRTADNRHFSVPKPSQRTESPKSAREFAPVTFNALYWPVIGADPRAARLWQRAGHGSHRPMSPPASVSLEKLSISELRDRVGGLVLALDQLRAESLYANKFLTAAGSARRAGVR